LQRRSTTQEPQTMQSKVVDMGRQDSGLKQHHPDRVVPTCTVID
jgi:hypothetical protein